MEAVTAARRRVEALTRPRLPRPPRPMTPKDREDTLEAAAAGGLCRFCGAIHPLPTSPACPRLATFKLNGDGAVTEGSFWPDGVTDIDTTLTDNGDVATTCHVHNGWDITRVVDPADAADTTGTDNTDNAEDAEDADAGPGN